MSVNTAQSVLRVGQLNPAHHIDPMTARDTESMFVVRQVFESPFVANVGTTEIEPLLFEGALQTVHGADFLEYRARIRRDVLFSDGTPLTSRHVADSLEGAGLLSGQATVAVVGDDLVFRPRHPNARLGLTLSHGQCCVARRENGEILGTGPFRVDPQSIPEHVRLVRNPHYRGDVALDEIHFVAYPPDAGGRPTALLDAIKRGEVDLTTALPRDEIDSLAGVRKSILPGISTALLYLNAESPHLADTRRRQAIARSIDRLTVARTCYANALAFAAISMLPRPLAAADDELTYDPVAGRRLLQESGGFTGSLKLLTIWGPRAYVPHPRRVAENIVAQLAKVGIAVEIVPTSTSTEFFEALYRGNYDMVLGGWVADTMDPCDFLESVLASSRVPAPENMTVCANHARFRSAELDRALVKLRGDRDSDSLQEIMHLVGEEAPVVPLMYGPAAMVSSFKVCNLKPTPLANFPLTAVSFDQPAQIEERASRRRRLIRGGSVSPSARVG